MKVFYLSLLVLSSLPTLAQRSFQIGLSAGGNYVNNVLAPRNGNSIAYDYRLSYHIGVATRVEISDRLWIAPSAIFSDKGWSSSSSKVHLSYLTLPLELEYYLIQNVGLRFGPQVGYLTGAKNHVNGEKIDLLDFWGRFFGVNRLDVGISAGTTLKVRQDLLVNFAYIHGLSSIIDPTVMLVDNQLNVISEKGPEQQNRSFQLSISFFPFN